MKKFLSLLLFVVFFAFTSGVVFAEEEVDFDEMKDFVSATAEATCYILTMENMFDPVAEEKALEIYESYGFDTSSDAMEALTQKYEQNATFQRAINILITLCVTDNPFSDLPDEHKNGPAIVYLFTEDIVKGYDDGTFKPDNTVNRAELLKILVEGLNISPTVKEHSDCFPDVKKEWFAPYVCYAKWHGWVEGYSDGTFKPAQTVNKVEAIKMLLKSQGVQVFKTVEFAPFDDVPIDSWFAPFVATAKFMGLLEEGGNNYNPAGDMSRAMISENLFRLLMYYPPVD